MSRLQPRDDPGRPITNVNNNVGCSTTGSITSGLCTRPRFESMATTNLGVNFPDRASPTITLFGAKTQDLELETNLKTGKNFNGPGAPRIFAKAGIRYG